VRHRRHLPRWRRPLPVGSAVGRDARGGCHRDRRSDSPADRRSTADGDPSPRRPDLPRRVLRRAARPETGRGDRSLPARQHVPRRAAAPVHGRARRVPPRRGAGGRNGAAAGRLLSLAPGSPGRAVAVRPRPRLAEPELPDRVGAPGSGEGGAVVAAQGRPLGLRRRVRLLVRFTMHTVDIPSSAPPARSPAPRLDHLRALEAESIAIMREVVAEFERPVMLYSIGKDSSVLLRLAQKAFYPGPIPFPLLHVDTTYK